MIVSNPSELEHNLGRLTRSEIIGALFGPSTTFVKIWIFAPPQPLR